MKMKILLFLALGLFINFIQAQDSKEVSKLKLFDEQKPSNATSKYLSKVVFSNSEIKKDDPESKFITTYKFGDKLYIKSFLANSITNSALIQLVEQGLKAKQVNKDMFSYINFLEVNYKLYIDGKEVTKSSGNTYGDDKHSSVNITNCIYDAENKNRNEEFSEKLYQELLNRPELLVPGNHKLKIEATLICPQCPSSNGTEKLLAAGEIDMVIPKELKVNETDCFPIKQWSDAKLENEALKLFKRRTDAYKVILTDKNYTVIKNEYGIPLRKSFMAVVVFKNGNDVTYEYAVFEKIFDGVNYQGLQTGQVNSIPGRYPENNGKKVNADCLKFLK